MDRNGDGKESKQREKTDSRRKEGEGQRNIDTTSARVFRHSSCTAQFESLRANRKDGSATRDSSAGSRNAGGVVGELIEDYKSQLTAGQAQVEEHEKAIKEHEKAIAKLEERDRQIKEKLSLLRELTND